MKRLFTFLAVALFLSVSAEQVSAHGRRGHGCGGGYGGYETAGCAPAPQQYMAVQRVVRTMVPVVTEQEITELVCKPVPHEEVRERMVSYPVMKEEVRKYMVCQTNMVEKEFERTVSRPVMKEEVRKFMVCQTNMVEKEFERTVSKPVMTTVNRDVVERVPVMTQVPQKRMVCTYQDVVENGVRKVCTMQRVPYEVCCPDPCNPCNTITRTMFRCVPVTQDVPYSYTRRVAVPTETTVMVNVCTFKEEKKTVAVQVCNYESQVVKYKALVPVQSMVEQSAKVQVCTYETGVEKYKALVPVQNMVEQSAKVQVCVMETKPEKYTAKWVEYTTEKQTRKVQVTTYKCVETVVTEMVPCGFGGGH